MAEIDSVYRVARSLAPQPSEADDLVQETYLRAIRSWQSFTLHDHGIRPWLLKILHNTHINRSVSRSRERKRHEPAELDHLPSATEVPEQIDWSQFDGQLLRAVDDLPVGLRAPITLWALEELTYKEIAEVLDIPIGTVMSRLHRARALLQQSLADLARERGIKQGS